MRQPAFNGELKFDLSLRKDFELFTEEAIVPLAILGETTIGPAPQDFLGHRIVMKMDQRSQGGVYEQGERTSFGSHGGSPKGEWSGSRRAARRSRPVVGEAQVCSGAAAAGGNPSPIQACIKPIAAPKNNLARRLPGIYLVLLPAGNASRPVTNCKAQWLHPIRTLQRQHGSAPAAVAAVSRA
jgi:hypothetical protein